MVAESNPARRRADSSTRRPVRRTRWIIAGVVGALLGSVVSAPLAANAGIDPTAGLQSLLGAAAGTGASSDAAGGMSRSGPMQAVDEEDGGLRVRVSPTIATTISLTAPVAISVEIENATGEALAPGVVRLVRASGAIDDHAALDDWLVADVEDGAGISGAVVAIAESESRSLAAGGATVVSFTVPGEALADLAALSGASASAPSSAWATRSWPPAPGPTRTRTSRLRARSRSHSPRRSPPRPRAIPPASSSPRRLENWTGPTGLLTRQLDALAGRRVAIGIDPRIIASIRVLGSSAPPSATAWLQRLSEMPNEMFPLAYADADLAVQAQLDLPELLDADLVLRRARPGELRRRRRRRHDRRRRRSRHRRVGRARADAGRRADHRATARLAVHAHRPRLAGRRHRRDRRPRVLRRGRAHDGAPRSRQRRADRGSRALVGDDRRLHCARGRRRPHRAAARGIRCLDRRRMAAGHRRTARRTGARRGRGAHDRARHVRPGCGLPVRPGRRGHRRHRRIAAGPRSPACPTRSARHRPNARWSTFPRPTSASRWSGAPSQAEADVTEFATVLDDPAQLTGPTRRELSSLLDVAWLADREAWNATVSDWLATQRAVLGQRLGRAEQHHQRRVHRDRRARHRSTTRCRTR